MKHCARCGKRLSASKPRVFSHFSRAYYCADLDACARRARRGRRQAVAA